jgi:hypothetical protein
VTIQTPKLAGDFAESNHATLEQYGERERPGAVEWAALTQTRSLPVLFDVVPAFGYKGGAMMNSGETTAPGAKRAGKKMAGGSV